MVVEVLVGMLASGKSLYARERAEGGAMVVCLDDLTAMLHGRPHYIPGERRTYHEMEDALIRIALKAGRDVVIDRTNLARKTRARWVAVAREVGAKVIAVSFPADRSGVHAARRFEDDHRGYMLAHWKAVAFQQRQQVEDEPLDESEGFDEIRLIGDHSNSAMSFREELRDIAERIAVARRRS